MTWTIDPVRRAHDDDRAYLDSLSWRPGRCHFCRYHVAQTTEFAHIEQGTLPGYALMVCLEHAAYELTLSRAEAVNAGRAFVPDIRRLAR
ncbi:hypothetical protein [Streptacidiphilus monticola]|uniref:HNH endonuclease n=1 Tax=Streptacidiphilus monticola TaxID=2161674 RepID=A0ABW1G7I9_9ACTN